MNVGALLERAALATALVALVAQAVAIARPSRAARCLALGSALASAALVALALALLVSDFLLSRMDVEYVFLYSRRDYPWYYRLVGTWGAQKGTILLWSALTGGALVAFVAATRRVTDPARKDARAWIVAFLLLVHVAFLVLLVRQDTFAPTTDFLLRSRPMGNGLSPVLLTPLSIVHPPAEFLGYALTGVLAAGALAAFATGTPAWSRELAVWTRITWIVFTLGIALGALWAYTTLSFGGYWAWDPVEVANLVPWLALTAFVHARAQHERYGTYRSLGPALAFAAFWLSLLATFATRSGLWVSVHAFADPTGTFARDPLLRAMNILHADARVADLAALMGASLFVALALAHATLAPRAGVLRGGLVAAHLAAAGAFAAAPTTATGLLFEGLARATGGHADLGLGVLLFALLAAPAVPGLFAEGSSRGDARRVLSFRTLAGAAVVVLVVALVATLVLDARGVNGLDRKVFDDVAPFVALALVLVLVPFFGAGRLSLRTLVGLAAVALALGILAAFLAPVAWPIGLVAPSLVLALALGLDRLLRLVDPRHAPPAVRAVVALHLFASLVGLAYWASPPSYVGVPPFVFEPGAGATLAGLGLAAAALVLVPVVGHARSAAAALVAGLLDLLLVGLFGLASIAGLLALVLLVARRDDFERPGLVEGVARAASTHRALGLYAIHVGVVLLLVGYAASTYAAEAPGDSLVLPLGGSASVGNLTLRYVADAPIAEDAAHGFVTETDAIFAVEGADGTVVGREDVRFHWVDQVQHYDPETRILHLAWRDVYVASVAVCRDPKALCSADGDWIGAHENGVTPLRASETVTAVAFTAKVLPLVGLLWAGTALLLTGMIALLAATLARERFPRETARALAPGAALDAEVKRRAEQARRARASDAGDR